MTDNTGKKYNTELKDLQTGVKRLALVRIRNILEGKDDELGNNKDFKQQLILRLAGTVLPRETELSGFEGEPIEITIKNENEKGS